MEEKLYFKPEEYGRKKEKKPRQEGRGDESRKVIKLIILLLFITIIIFVIIWLLRGKTTISGQFPANIRNESLACYSETTTYEKTNNISSDDKKLKINMVFAGKDMLSSASLEYILTFNSYSEAHSAEAISHAQFNIGLQTLGYDASKFNNKFSIIDNKLAISLSLTSDKSLDDATHSYFLVDYMESGQLPKTLAEYKSNYEKQGFSCVSSIDNK